MLTKVRFSSGRDDISKAIDHPKSEDVPFSSPDCRMDVPTLSTFLSPILTVASVLNTGETGDLNMAMQRWLSLLLT